MEENSNILNLLIIIDKAHFNLEVGVMFWLTEKPTEISVKPLISTHYLIMIKKGANKSVTNDRYVDINDDFLNR